MGWSSGTKVFRDVVEILKEKIDDFDLRVEMYVDLIDVFSNHDWDNYDEILGEDEAYDEAFKQLFGEEEEDL